MKVNSKQLILFLFVVSMFSFVACTSIPDNIESAIVSNDSIKATDFNSLIWKPINVKSSTFEFEGYAPGKSHVGTFNLWSGEFGFKNDVLVVVRGAINASSVNTGISGLDNHLKSDDFFDVEVYPEIKVQSTNIDYATSTMYADLTFHGVTKSISFPVEITENGLKADFLLDTIPFNIKYVAINKDVRVAFELSI